MRRPITAIGRTNWELSAERANATRRLLTDAGLPETGSRSVTGHADRDPLLPADPLAAANRRIAIVVLRAAVPPDQGGDASAMLTIGGLVFLLACVFGSYLVSGGSMEPLIEALPFEMWTIGGAAIGTFVMSNSMHDVKHTLGGFGKIMKGRRYQARPTTSNC